MYCFKIQKTSSLYRGQIEGFLKTFDAVQPRLASCCMGFRNAICTSRFPAERQSAIETGQQSDKYPYMAPLKNLKINHNFANIL
jgi:hypothetical protein